MSTQYAWNDLSVKLHSQIISYLTENLNFPTMMAVQKASIHHFLQNKDVAVEAATGSGKTLSFLIPIFQTLLTKIKSKQKHSIYALILSPTRELAAQIFKVTQAFAKYLKLSSNIFIGGQHMEHDLISYEKEGGNILVGTPGKLKEMFQNPNFILNVKSLEILVLDEADRLVDLEYSEDIQSILSVLPKQRRTAVFSATLGSNMEIFQKLGMRNPVKIALKKKDGCEGNYFIPDSLQNEYIICSNRYEKIKILLSLLKQKSDQKLMIFVNTCASVDFYGKLLKSLPFFQNIKVLDIHGQMKQKKRNKVIEEFRNLEKGFLIGTDVVARGIDFDDIEYIMQVDPPQDPNFYIHRVGRTARVGRKGSALLFLEPNELSFIDYLKLKNVDVQQVDVQNSIEDSLIKDIIVGLFRDDRDFIEKGKRAFVSFIRSYKEHDLKFIFTFHKLDLGHVANSFFLRTVPRVKEILGVKLEHFNPINLGNIAEITFKDKNQGKQFSDKQLIIQQKKQEFFDKKNEAQQFIMKKDYRNNKSLRKKVKREHDFEEQKVYRDELNLVKKLKQGQFNIQGKISLDDYKQQMKIIEGDLFDETLITTKSILKKNIK